MDVAVRAAYVPLSRGALVQRIRRILLFFCLFLCLFLASGSAWSVENVTPMHWSGDKTVWDRKANRVYLYGHGAVHQPGETLTADEIVIDLESRTLDGKGNCIYIASEAVIYGSEMHFNLDTRTGSIINGRVSNDRFSLTGERINKLGPSRFQTHRGAYSTCVDCAPSWTLTGEDVDMEFGGYAYMSNVTAQIKDTPLLWVPYLIVPMKTRRQTGILFPKFGFSNEGFTFLLPYFWAINESSDMTIGLGHYGGRGNRLEWEGRYKLSSRSGGTVNFFYLSDSKFEKFLSDDRGVASATPHRWALNLAQMQELPWKIDAKLRIIEMSDNLYPFRVGDIPGGGEAFVASEEISFSRATSQMSTYVVARRFRNLLNADPDPRTFDSRTVQILPAAMMTTNDRFLFGTPVAAGLSVGVTNFTRTTPTAFDRDPPLKDSTPVAEDSPIRKGQDPIRKTTRVMLTPSLYTVLRPWDLFSLVPSLEYRGFFSSFHNELHSLSRGYLLFQVDFSTQLERIFETDNPEVPKVKHLVRPILTYSRIPYEHEDDKAHPFLTQIKYAQDHDFSGYNFDSYDIVPTDTSKAYNTYFTPLGHSLSIGVTTQVIRRLEKLAEKSPSYQRVLELRTGETINFREWEREEELRKRNADLVANGQQPEEIPRSEPYSRYFAAMLAEFDRWRGSVDYSYMPYAPIDQDRRRHTLSVSTSYILEQSVRQRILAFDRSFGLGYSYSKLGSQTDNIRLNINYSLSDYILPSFAISYDLISKKMMEASGSFRLQSPSQCWRFDIGTQLYSCIKQGEINTSVCHRVGIDFSLNLTGSGFGGITEAAASAINR
jgi:lipopolysaccharide export system protein LptA